MSSEEPHRRDEAERHDVARDIAIRAWCFLSHDLSDLAMRGMVKNGCGASRSTGSDGL